jgi:hypothetical protein
MKSPADHKAPASTNKAPFFSKGGTNICNNNSFFSSKNDTPPVIQAKLNINQPGDKYEQEADAVADKVAPIMSSTYFDTKHSGSFFNTGNNSIQRKCNSCEQNEKLQKMNIGEEDKENVQRKPIFESIREEPVQRKENNGIASETSNSIESNLGQSKGNGSQIPASVNDSMSSAMGYDFSHVRIHTDSTAKQMNNELNAQAFTHGNDIYFNEGNYNTNNNAGKHLLAHELTHVVQQSKSDDNVINRSVNDNSVCDNTVDANAPPSPLIFIILSDSMADMHLSMAKMTLSLDLMQTNGIPAGQGFDAYRRRFGDPTAVRNKFRNRFNTSLHDTLAEAQASEMTSLIGILDRLSGVLARDINYRCIGPHIRTIGGVRFDCATTGFALISFNGVNRIIICPAFWNLSASQQGIAIIHEAVHILFPFGDHDVTPAQTSNERRTEPECYASLVADINNVAPFDTSCPPV